ncbi:MAG: class I SAM-dependent methyltransferase [Anaerolineales bacterium]|nr:class I SAM-dependent methyltransferase [Anaerolineales bacterium]
MLPHDNLEEFQDPANYDLEEIPGAGARIAFYAALARQVGDPVLEIACGNGIVAIPIAQTGLAVTGVDLARPMLAHGRGKAERLRLAVEWVEGDARQLDLGRRFRFVYITGNAFQALQTRVDQSAFLSTVLRHLAEDGVFAFETRNPAGHDLSDQPDETFWFRYVGVEGHAIEVSGTQAFDPAAQVLHWTTYRRWRDAAGPHVRTTRIACRFTNVADLDVLLREHGFEVTQRFGGFEGEAFAPDSPSIVSICRRLEPGL